MYWVSFSYDGGFFLNYLGMVMFFDENGVLVVVLFVEIGFWCFVCLVIVVDVGLVLLFLMVLLVMCMVDDVEVL